MPSIQRYIRKTSDLNGNHFKKCVLCEQVFQMSTSSSIIKRHIERKHSEEYAKFMIDQVDAVAHQDVDLQDTDSVQSTTSTSSSSFSSKLKQPTLLPSLCQYQNADCLETIAKCFAMESLPHRLLESPIFINMMNAFRKSTIDLPKRKQLTGLQSTLSAKLIDSMLNNLSVGEIPSSIALDGWMNVRHCDVTNILILSNGSSYLYRSIEN
jgi:hypothetical protein